MSTIKKSLNTLLKAKLIEPIPENIQNLNDLVYEKVTNSEKDGYLCMVLGLSAEKFQNKLLQRNFEKQQQERDLGVETITVYKNGIKIEKEIDKNK